MEQDWFSFFDNMMKVDTKAEITNMYINGLIDKDEFIRRMNEYRRDKI